MNQVDMIYNVNERLKAQFGIKHIPITMADIEKTYFRQVLGIINAKTVKGEKMGYLTGILYLAPSDLSGINICSKASIGCKAACLFSAGRGRFYGVTRARLIKTLAYHFDKTRFYATIKKSIKSLLVKAKHKRLTPVVRLNGTSDLLWELNSDIIESFPMVQFYDYSAIAKRFLFSRPSNYDLTFSLKENNLNDMLTVLSRGGRVAVVFRGDIPSTFMGYPVVNGDASDLRFLDPQSCIVGLKAKGMAKRDTSGFVKDSVDSLRVAA